jgi:CheY-like chemotaxis protein
MSKIKIALVDDEPDVVLFLQTALEDNDFIALTATGAVEGLDLIRREQPSLVCLDILMPEESGLSLYHKLKSDPGLRHIPVIILSGLSLSKDLRDVDYLRLEDGTTIPEPEGFIEKPAVADQFIALVREVLG